jgi:protein-disulfide isomerase
MSRLTIPITINDHRQGEADAKCTLVEYGDFQCPACGQAAPIVRRLQDHFGADLQLVFRHFPLREIHPNAEHAAETAEFSGDNGKFWQMHDLLYQNQATLEDQHLLAFAGHLCLSEDELREALHAETYQPWVAVDFRGGVHSGVNGTPTFFLNGQRHDGAFDFETLAVRIQQQIETAGRNK